MVGSSDCLAAEDQNTLLATDCDEAGDRAVFTVRKAGTLHGKEAYEVANKGLTMDSYPDNGKRTVFFGSVDPEGEGPRVIFQK